MDSSSGLTVNNICTLLKSLSGIAYQTMTINGTTSYSNSYNNGSIQHAGDTVTFTFDLSAIPSNAYGISFDNLRGSMTGTIVYNLQITLNGRTTTFNNYNCSGGIPILIDTYVKKGDTLSIVATCAKEWMQYYNDNVLYSSSTTLNYYLL